MFLVIQVSDVPEIGVRICSFSHCTNQQTAGIMWKGIYRISFHRVFQGKAFHISNIDVVVEMNKVSSFILFHVTAGSS